MNKVTRADFTMEVLPDEDHDASWLDQEGYEERLAAYRRGDFHFVGVRASVELRLPCEQGTTVLHTVESPGLWGVESDSPEYHKEVFEQECSALEDMLREIALAVGPTDDAGLTKEQAETLVLARSLIRDMAHGWPSKELAASPESVAARITCLLGGTYDFATGDSTPDGEDVK